MHEHEHEGAAIVVAAVMVPTATWLVAALGAVTLVVRATSAPAPRPGAARARRAWPLP